jgi:hypothetical protein
VHDLKTGEEWTILDRRGVIGRWDVFGKPPTKEEPFAARANPVHGGPGGHQQGRALDDRDARVAILNRCGRAAHRAAVSPARPRCGMPAYEPEHDLIFLRSRRTPTAMGSFTYDDEALP